MISYKLLGGGMILGVGVTAAILGIRRERRTLSVLDGWIDLVSLIRNQIECYMTPLDEILRQASANGIDLPAPKNEDASLSSLFHATKGGLNEEERRLVERFVYEIGNGYREDQIRMCDYYLNSLRALRQTRAAELGPRIRVLLALCLGASLGTAILLW